MCIWHALVDWIFYGQSRAITKWTNACDKRLTRLISYIRCTSDYKQYCHVGNTAQHCRLVLFHDSDFAGDLEDSKSLRAGFFNVFSEVEHLFLSVGCARNRHQFHTVQQNLRLFLTEYLRLISGI